MIQYEDDWLMDTLERGHIPVQYEALSPQLDDNVPWNYGQRIDNNNIWCFLVPTDSNLPSGNRNPN